MESKYLIISQAVSALGTVLRYFIIMEVLGAGALGQYSISLSALMFLTMVGQFINNQAMQVALIKAEVAYKLTVYSAILAMFILYIVIVYIFWFCFSDLIQSYFSLVESRLVFEVILFSIPFTLINSLFELRFIAASRLSTYYYSLALSSLASLLFVLLVININNYALVVWLPLVSAGASFIYYIVASFRDVSKIFLNIRVVDFERALKLLKSTWYMNLIPFVNLSADFIVKLAFIGSVGQASLGYYQLLVSVEAMIGNVILGPFFKKLMVKYSSTKSLISKSLDGDIVNVMLLALLPILGLFFVYLVNNYIKFEFESLELIIPLIVISLIRVLWSIWGGVAQALLAVERSKYVTIIEIGSRVLVALLLVFLLQINGDLSLQ